MSDPSSDPRRRGHLLDRLETWVESHREELSVAGDVTFRRGPEERDNRSAELVVAGARDVLELVLWESGEWSWASGRSTSSVSRRRWKQMRGCGGRASDDPNGDILTGVQPEEMDPALLVGRHVVEIGMRQAWPFLTLADPESGREVRLYVDAPLTVGSGGTPIRQDDPKVLSAMDDLNGRTVAGAGIVDGALVLRVEDVELRVSGEANELTTGSPWWVGVQALGVRAAADGTVTAFGVRFRLSLQRALWRMIVPSIRAIALGWDDGVGRARFVFDDVPREDERELVAEVETEVIADLAETDVVEFTTAVSPADRPRLEPGERWWAYVRYEEPDGPR